MKETSKFDLKKARLNAGLSARGAAAEVGLAYGVWRRIEQGLSVKPENAKRIADYFGVPVTDLPYFRDQIKG